MLRIPIWPNFGPMGPKKGKNRQKIAKFEKGLKNLPLDEYFIFSQKSIIYCVNNWNQEEKVWDSALGIKGGQKAQKSENAIF